MSLAPGWPATVVHGRVGIRPLRVRDAAAWTEMRLRNEDWLSRWEGSQPHLPPSPWPDRHTQSSFTAMLRSLRHESRAGRCLPFAVTYDGDLAGQVTVAHLQRGAAQSANVGYWLDERIAGRGVMPTALAMAVDHAFGRAGLHRIEANVRPENTASLRVLHKLGFRQEGLHMRFLFIDQQWRDHLGFALTVDEQPEGVLRRLMATDSD